MSKYWQDEELLLQLRSDNHRLWKQFFDEHLEVFQLFLIKYANMPRESTLELFQEAIVILHRNITSEKLASPLRAGLQTYLFGIGKNLCRRRTSAALNFPADIPDIPENPFEEDDERKHNATLVRNLLNRIDEKCRRFLTLVFLEEQPQEDIILEMAIPSAEAFRKRKFDCLKRMRELL